MLGALWGGADDGLLGSSFHSQPEGVKRPEKVEHIVKQPLTHRTTLTGVLRVRHVDEALSDSRMPSSLSRITPVKGTHRQTWDVRGPAGALTALLGQNHGPLCDTSTY